MPDLNDVLQGPAAPTDLNDVLRPPEAQQQSEPELPPIHKHYVGAMQSDLHLSGRTNADDEDIKSFAANRSSAYGASLKQQFPSLPDEKVQAATDAYRQDLAERAQGQRLRQSVRDQMEYLKSGVDFPLIGKFRRATGEDLAGVLPGGRHLAGIAEAVQLKNASERLQQGSATQDDYDYVAQHLARQQYDANVREQAGKGGGKGIAQTAWDISSQLPAEVAEWMALGGPVGAAGKVSEGLAENAGAGALRKATANFIGRLATRQLLTSYRTLPAAIQGLSPTVNMDDQGKVVTQEGAGSKEAFKKAWLTQLYTNGAFEFSGALDPKVGFSPANIALSTTKAVGAIQTAKSLGYYGGGGGPGDIFTEVANQTTWEKKREALVHFGVEAGVFGALETAMHSKGETGEPPDPAKVVDSMKVRLQQEGIPEQHSDKAIAGILSEIKAKSDAGELQIQPHPAGEHLPPTSSTNDPNNQITPSTPLTHSVVIVPSAPDAAGHDASDSATPEPVDTTNHLDPSHLADMRRLLGITNRGKGAKSVADMSDAEVVSEFNHHYGTEAEVEKTPPQKAATYEPPPGERGNWHDTYATARADGKSHEDATESADKANPTGQTWVHSGTKLTPAGDGATYEGSDGKRYEISHREQPVSDAWPDGGYHLAVKDADGHTVSTSGFVVQPDGSLKANSVDNTGPEGRQGPKGVGRAMYDYVTEKGGRIRPNRDWQSKDGKGFWQNNAELALPEGERSWQKPSSEKPVDKPKTAEPVDRDETPEEYLEKLKPILRKYGIPHESIEKSVLDSHAEDFPEFRRYAKDNRLSFRDSETAMKYAKVLFEAEASHQNQESQGHPDSQDLFTKAGLTPKESQVANLLLENLSLRDVGDRVGVSHQTVANWTQAIRAKLAKATGVDGATMLAHWDEAVQQSSAPDPVDAQLAFGEATRVRKTTEGKSYTQNPRQALFDQLADVQNKYDKATRSGTLTAKLAKQYDTKIRGIYDQLDSLNKPIEPETVQRVAGSEVPQGGTPASTPASPEATDSGSAAGPATGFTPSSDAGSPDLNRGADAGPERNQTSSDRLSPQEVAPDEVAKVETDLKDAKAKGYHVDASAEELLAEVDKQAEAAAHEAVFASQRPGDHAPAPDGSTTVVPGAEPGADANTVPSISTGDPGRGADPATGQPTERGSGGVSYESIVAGIREFIADERGSVDLDLLMQKGSELQQKVQAMFREASDVAGKLSGKHFPSTAKTSKTVAEKMGLLAGSAEYVRRSIPRVIDKVFGPQATVADRLKAGAVLTELNLRQTKAYYLDRARNASNAALAEQAKGAQGNPAAVKDLFAEADEAGRIAREVKTVFTQDNSPIKTEAEYQATLADPKMKQVLDAYRQHFVDTIMEPNYRQSKGLSDAEDIQDGTQHPGYPVNLMAAGDELQPGEVPPPGASRGNLKNIQQKYNVFANQRHGNADAYELDLAKIMDNSMRRTDALAKRADLDRTIVSEGIGEWGKQGQRGVEVNGKPAVEAPFVRPPKGTSQAAPGESSLYLDPDVYNDYRQLMGIDKPFRIPIVTPLSQIPTLATMASGVEAVYHVKNLLTAWAKPGMNPLGLFTNSVKLLTGDPEIQDRIIELARIDAMRSQHEGGVLSRLVGPEANKYDPTYYMGKMLNLLDTAVRLTASDAIDTLKRQGRVDGTDLERADFVNQIAGNYNKKSASQLVNFLRETGIGPFATAGTNYYMQGLRSLVFDPGVKGTTWQHSVGLRAEVAARSLGALAAGALVNYFAWGRPDGDDATPLGSIKLGNTSDGRTLHFGLANILTGLPRGARETGLLAGLEGKRQGQSVPHIIDKAQDDAFTSFVHPFAGPGVQLAYTAATGKNMLGQKVAAVPEPGGSAALENLKSALLQANPVVANLTASNVPGREASVGERLLNQAGPFTPKTSTSPVVRNYFTVLDDAKAARKQAVAKGEIIKGDNARQYQAALLAEKQMEALSNALKGKRMIGSKTVQGPAPDDATKAKIRALQEDLARRILNLR